jgi:hypothetical protein
VEVDGVASEHPSVTVPVGAVVTVDGQPVQAAPGSGAVLHRPPGAPIAFAHPGPLHAVLPIPDERGGLEVLLADAELAQRLADPRHPLAERWRGDRRVRLGAIDLGDLPVGAWRPLSPREIARLRLGARLPPTPR